MKETVDMIRGLRFVLGMFALVAAVSDCSNGLGPNDCCTNSQFYACTSSAQVNQCVTAMPNTCVRDSSMDHFCAIP